MKLVKRKQLVEVGIFPDPCELGHSFVPYNDTYEDRVRGFYKRKSNASDDVDSSKVYAMLYCTKCGETKEIAIVNRLR
jgi:hypothetical protein